MIGLLLSGFGISAGLDYGFLRRLLMTVMVLYERVRRLGRLIAFCIPPERDEISDHCTSHFIFTLHDHGTEIGPPPSATSMWKAGYNDM